MTIDSDHRDTFLLANYARRDISSVDGSPFNYVSRCYGVHYGPRHVVVKGAVTLADGDSVLMSRLMILGLVRGVTCFQLSETVQVGGLGPNGGRP